LKAPDVRAIVDRMRANPRGELIGPTALVTRNDVVFGMARMYELLSDDFDQQFHVFRGLADAVRWLETGTMSSRLR
jgi:hypothetical protein